MGVQHGWQPDPFDLHELRYYSKGEPTHLVKDGGVESYDDPPATPSTTEPNSSAAARAHHIPSASIQGAPRVEPSVQVAAPPPTRPPAGWFRDASNPDLLRYWDGSKWTDQTAATTTPPQRTKGPTPPEAPPSDSRPPPQIIYSAAPSYPATPRTSGLAIASLVLGLIPVVPFIGSILAIVFGIIALRQIDESRGTQRGRGMAIWGIVLGLLAIVTTGVVIIVLITHAQWSQPA